MKKIMESLSKSMVILAMVLSVLMAITITWSVVSRYFFSSPLSGVDEVVGMLFTSMVFLSLPYMFLNKMNIEITIFSTRWNVLKRTIMSVISHIMCIVFLGIFADLTLTYAIESYAFSAKSMVAEIPIWPCAMLAFIACVLAILTSVFNLVFEVRNYSSHQSSK